MSNRDLAVINERVHKISILPPLDVYVTFQCRNKVSFFVTCCTLIILCQRLLGHNFFCTGDRHFLWLTALINTNGGVRWIKLECFVVDAAGLFDGKLMTDVTQVFPIFYHFQVMRFYCMVVDLANTYEWWTKRAKVIKITQSRNAKMNMDCNFEVSFSWIWH